MAIVRPFRALRPEKKYAEQMISLPYDVMNRNEAAEMAAGNPYSFLHICRSEIDLPDQQDPYDRSVYLQAKRQIETYLTEGVLVRDEKPMFYIYRQVMDGRVQTGIVACTSIDDYQNDIIKKHEFTRVEKEIDRINHFDVCNTNTEPVFLTYRRSPEIDCIISGFLSNHTPAYDLVTEDGISHTLWIMEDEALVAKLSGLFSGIDSLYIADGHHRSASAVKVGLKRREANPSYSGEEEFNFYMSVIFPDSDLRIFDYNRVVKDLHGLSTASFLEKLREVCTVEPLAYTGTGADETETGRLNSVSRAPQAKHSFTMYLEDVWYTLTVKPELIDESDVIRSLDVSLLQELVLSPILGIADPRTDKRIDFVGGIRGLDELERRVKSDMKIAFAVYPVSIADLLAVSDQGLVMPPKSTWFEPKLGSGLFMHEL